MALLAKKDLDVLLNAGFDESDLGLVDGGKRGVELYESPDDYCARELIENACEQGECSLMDDMVPSGVYVEPYDRTRKGLWDDVEYAGNEDPTEDVKPELRDQVKFLLGIRVGKMSVWQRRKGNIFEWQVTNLNVIIPEEDKEKMLVMSKEDSKTLWIANAKNEWKKCWQAAIDSIWECPIDGTYKIKTKKGKELEILIIPAENLREIGYKNLPMEARWITMVFFRKDK